MVKYQFGKNWNWSNEIKTNDQINDNHLDIVYRLDANICQPGKCKVNCNTNPYCLNGLGEKKLTNLLQKDSTITIERNEFFRNKDEYAGLVNLGATCYINTYLQVWYNNPIFRESILNAEFPYNDISEQNLEIQNDNKSASLSESDKMPEIKLITSNSITYNLQLIFYLLKDSIRKSIDPNFFIKALGLDENMQQDAQEFCQLFLTILENKLPKNSNGNDIIKYLFEGGYSYITECSTCKRQSVKSSSFLELSLNIQNCGTIFECIDDLLKEETMDGDNQYYCDNCMNKKNAKRFTKITDLPPVLNLQLLRFVYDRNSGYKKKLSNKIKFPEILDLSKYKIDNNSSTDHSKSTYNLGAVLMHVGKSAYSGHYMAQIKNFETNEWYSFNDETINKIKKKQQLGCTDDEIEKQKNNSKQQLAESSDSNDNQTQTPTSKSTENLKSFKSFSTSNAYLLVYYRKDLIDSNDFINKNEVKLNKIVENDNIELEQWFENLKSNKLDEKETQNTERTIIRSIYNSLWCNNNTEKKDLYFICTDFIRKLLSNQTCIAASTSETINKYLCSHKHLNPFAINRFKLISKEGLDSVLTNYAYKLNEIGAFQAINNETTRCLQCINNIFDYLKLKDRIKDDTKLLRTLLKIDDPTSNSNDMNNLNGNHETNGLKLDTNQDIIVLDDNFDKNKKSPTSLFNEINLNSKKWYWIGKESIKLWTSLAVKRAESLLPPVKFNDIEVIDLTNNNGMSVEYQNGDINTNTNTCGNGNLENGNNNENCIEKQTNENDTDSIQITFAFNEDIVCTHGGLSTTINKRLVSHDVYRLFSTYFPNMRKFLSDEVECKKCKSNNEHYLMKTNEVKSQKEILSELYQNKNRPNIIECSNESVLYVVVIDFIKEWRSMIKNSKYRNIEINNKILLCEHDKLPFNEKNFDNTLGYLVTADEWNFISQNYKFDQEIRIQKVDSETIIFEPDVCESCFSQNELSKLLYENKKIFIRQKDDENDEASNANKEDNDLTNINPKKMKLSENDAEGVSNGSASPVVQKNSLSSLRRSKRSKKCKNDMEVIGSSFSTVKDIKLQITGKTNKLISEQHLFFNNVELENDRTLIDCKINPGDVIILKFDQNENDDFDCTNYELAHTPEIGFKGTNLYG